MHGNAVFFIWVFLLAGCRKPPLSAPDNGSKPAGGILPASYVLHDIWALESFRGRAVRSGDFSKGLPILEIYVAEGAGPHRLQPTGRQGGSRRQGHRVRKPDCNKSALSRQFRTGFPACLETGQRLLREKPPAGSAPKAPRTDGFPENRLKPPASGG